MYLLRPDIFTKRSCRVEIELAGRLTTGMSVADWSGKWGEPPNCEVLMTVNAAEFEEEFVARIGHLCNRVQ